MWQGTIILVEPLARPSLVCRDTHDILASWAEKHRAAKIEWVGNKAMLSDQESMWPKDSGYVKLWDCWVSPEEFDEKGMLHIGPFRAYMGHGVYVPDPKEETPTSMADSFRQFVNEFFNVAHIAPDMQEAVWDMSLRHFCDIWANTATKEQSHQDKYILSRRQLLTKAQDVICPACGRKGGLHMVDGIVECKFCTTNFGDVDNIPD